MSRHARVSLKAIAAPEDDTEQLVDFDDEDAPTNSGNGPQFPFDLRAILVVLAGLVLAWAITMTVLYATKKQATGGSEPPTAFDGCQYSTPELIDLRLRTTDWLSQASQWTGGLPFTPLALERWSVLRGVNNVADIRYVTSLEDAMAWPLYAEATALVALAKSAMADPRNRDMERANAGFVVLELGNWINQTWNPYDETTTNWYHNIHGAVSSDIAWDFHPYDRILLDSFYATFLWVGEPAFEIGWNIYAQQFVDTLPHWTQWMEDTLASGTPHVHANITWVTMLTNNDPYDDPGFMLAVCDVFVDAGRKATCEDLSALVDAVIADWKVVAAGDYLDACASIRPDSTPGLSAAHQGAESYRQWIRYHTELNLSPADIVTIGTALLPDRIAKIDAAMARRGETFADYLACTEDLDNPECNMPSGDPACVESGFPFNDNVCHRDLIDYQWAVFGNLSATFTEVNGYGGRVTVKQGTDGSPFTYVFCPGYDADRSLWTFVPCTINWGRSGVNSDDRVVFDITQSLTTQTHEGVVGHIAQLSVLFEVQCPVTNLSASTAWFEGYGLWTESLPFGMGVTPETPLGLYQEPLQEAGRWAADVLRTVRLLVDPGMHALGESYQDCVDAFAANALGSGYGGSECRRYINMPAQAVAYMLGRIEFDRILDKVETALGADFDIHEFMLMVTKFGGFALYSTVEQYFDTYILWKQGNLDAVGRIGYDLLVYDFYRQAAPTIGLGKDISKRTDLLQNGGVAPSAVSTTEVGVSQEVFVERMALANAQYAIERGPRMPAVQRVSLK